MGILCHYEYIQTYVPLEKKKNLSECISMLKQWVVKVKANYFNNLNNQAVK